MSHVKEQSADYQLADLSPVLKATEAGNILLESLPIWLSAQTRKSAGRGRSANNTLQYGVQKLRELILELAVRGKLVEQNPDDEPARVLLEKIAEEKARLVREGKIKKQKPLPEIAPSEVFLDEPAGWQSVRLGDIVQIIRGITFPASEKSKTPEDGRVACLRTTNVQQNIEWDDLLFISESFISRNEQYIQPQDIVMSMANSRELVGKVALVDSKPDMPVTFGGFLGVIRPIQLNPMFLMIALRTPQIKNELIGSASQTTNIANISIGKLNPMVFPVPPLPEQHRIVKKVDELMALCDQLEQQQADAVQAHDTLVNVLLDTLTQSENAEDFQQNWHRIAKHFDTLFTTESSIDQLKQTLLQLAVMGKLVPQDPNDEAASVLHEKIAEEKAHLVKQGKIKKQKPLGQLTLEEHPFKLPSGWMWVHWNEILANDDAPFKRGPFGSALKKDMFVSSGYKVYEQYCPINDDCSYERYFITEEKFKSMEGFSVREDDYLVSCSGVTLGRITQVPKDFKEGIINQALLRVRINHKYVDKNFFKLLFRSPYFQKLIFDNSTGSAIPNVKGVKELKIMPVPLLPLAEQREIIAKFEEMMVMCDQLKDRLNQTQTLQQKLADTVINEALR